MEESVDEINNMVEALKEEQSACAARTGAEQ